MQLTSFVVRTAVLLLPGVISSKVYRKLRGRTRKRYWEDLLEILVFSVLSYAVLGLLVSVRASADKHEDNGHEDSETQPVGDPSEETTGVKGTEPDALLALTQERTPFRWSDVFGASVIGVLLGFAGGYVHNFSLVNKIGQMIGATKRAGDEDVWQTFLDRKDVKWAVVRDHARNLVYYGYIRYYSDSGESRELTLENVDVYTNDTAEELYSTAVVFLSRADHDITVEVPKGLNTVESNDDQGEENENEEDQQQVG